MTQEALSSLKALGKQLRLRLRESPEFRALEVVDRTIQELTKILNSTEAPPDIAAAAAPVDEPPKEPAAPVSAVEPHAQTAATAPASSQSRMAKAIAATIAANTTPTNASSGTAPRFNHLLSVAS